MRFFSERCGYKKADESSYIEGMPESLKIRVWNLFKLWIFKPIIENKPKIIPNKLIFIEKPKITTIIIRGYESKLHEFFENLWDEFFKEDLDKLSDCLFDIRNLIKTRYMNLEWFEAYDFVEYCLEKLEEFELYIS